MARARLITAFGALSFACLCLPAASWAGTYTETTGGVSHTWTNYTNAGGTQGPSIPSNDSIQITCALNGFTVADGNTWWYQIASSPWNNQFYVSADAFYNNGATSGSLHGTPYVDPAVPICGSEGGGGSSPPAATGTPETTGGVSNTWTNYTNAGGTEGSQIPSNTTVQIACRLTGFTVADGNTWWYQISSSPWNSQYYVSADAFYNNGSASGSLIGTPFVDSAVPLCGGSGGGNSGGSKPAPNVSLSQGPAAPQGYRYAITLSNFPANSSVSVNCYDSVSPNGFYPFTLTTDSSGNASTASYCYSGDGPDHWVVAGGYQSNHVQWSAATSSGSTGSSSSSGTGSSNGSSGSGNSGTSTAGTSTTSSGSTSTGTSSTGSSSTTPSSSPTIKIPKLPITVGKFIYITLTPTEEDIILGATIEAFTNTLTGVVCVESIVRLGTKGIVACRTTIKVVSTAIDVALVKYANAPCTVQIRLNYFPSVSLNGISYLKCN